MHTVVKRVDLTSKDPIADTIETKSDNMLASGFRVASTFVIGNSLMIVYQKLPPGS